MSEVVHDVEARQFSTVVDGHRAILDYHLAGKVMTITHTGVPNAIGGRGVAAELMKAALDVAKQSNWTVDPACSYAAAYMRRHPENSQARHLDDLLDEALEESFPASDPPAVGGIS